MTGTTRSTPPRDTPRKVLAAGVTAAVVAGVLVLVWAATTGPVAVVVPGRRRVHRSFAPTEQASASPGPADPMQQLRNGPHGHALAWLGTLIAWAVLLVIVAVVVAVLVWAWQHRWHRPPAPPDIEFETAPDPQEIADALARTAHARNASLALGSPRNGIVRCWVALEESIAEAGLPPARWETSTEFTVRVLHSLDLDPAAVGRLAGLYRAARFSEHELTEQDRGAAREALRTLDAELSALAAHIGERA
ncbi:MAG TPA: DUF4129 domain-containing protein [Nocardioidaceae bacterium]|nr:DUF4129 domain-containing protein [Nocardioidaceae bacterium]